MATVSNGQTRSPGKAPAGADKALAGALEDVGCSCAAPVLRVNGLGRGQGVESNHDKASATRWLQGRQPCGGAPELIAAALSERLGRSLTPAGLGFLPDQQRPVAARALTHRDDVTETLHTHGRGLFTEAAPAGNPRRGGGDRTGAGDRRRAGRRPGRPPVPTRHEREAGVVHPGTAGTVMTPRELR